MAENVKYVTNDVPILNAQTAETGTGQIIIYGTDNFGNPVYTILEEKPPEWYSTLQRKLYTSKKKTDEAPQALSWIPVAINYIDDAQDLLITGLNFIKPLAKYLPGFAGKGIGWALKASDKMNNATEVLAKAMNPFTKIHTLWKDSPNGKTKTKTPLGRMDDWLKQKGWQNMLGTFLQGAQATDTIWGKGLQLGAIMGAYNEATWASMDFLYSFIDPAYSGSFQERIDGINKEYQEAVVKGQEIITAVGDAVDDLWSDWLSLWGVKRSTIEETSLRVLMQFNQLPNLIDFYDDDEVINIITATRVAMSVLSSQQNVMMDHRVDRFLQLPYPRPYPVKETSIAALRSAGIEYKDCLPAVNTDNGWPTIKDAMEDGIKNHDALETKLRARADKDPEKWLPAYNLWAEAGREFLQTVIPFEEEDYVEYDDHVFVASSCDKHNFMLQDGYTQTDLENLLTTASRIAQEKGYKQPTENDWIQAAGLNKIQWKKKR